MTTKQTKKIDSDELANNIIAACAMLRDIPVEGLTKVRRLQRRMALRELEEVLTRHHELFEELVASTCDMMGVL